LLSDEVQKLLREQTRALALELNVLGLMNIPIAPHKKINTEEELSIASDQLGELILKTVTGGVLSYQKIL